MGGKREGRFGHAAAGTSGPNSGCTAASGTTTRSSQHAAERRQFNRWRCNLAGGRFGNPQQCDECIEAAILKGDVLQTSATGTLGITFDDETTFTLTPNSRIAVDDFVYQEGGTHNAAVFNVLRGTVAFVASEVAKTGNMKIDTPTATLGIRGTSGVVDVPEGAAAGTAQIGIKLYPDADGRVGQIEVFGRDGAQLGILNRGATGFAIRPGLPGAPQRFSAVPLQISAQEAARDRSFVRQAVSSQRVGRQINIERRNLRQNNPQRPNQPRPNLRQPGQQPAPGRERRPELQPQPGQPVPGRQAGGGPQRGGSGGPPRAPAPPKKPPPKGKNQSR